MHLLKHVAYRNRPHSPSDKEDPFTLIAKDCFFSIKAITHEVGCFTRPAIMVANCFGGWTFGEPQLERLRIQGPRRVSAYQAIAWFPAAAQGQVTIANRITGPALTFSSEFFAFHDALIAGKFLLEQNACDVLYVGATESVGSRFAAKAVSAENCEDAVVWFSFARKGGKPFSSPIWNSLIGGAEDVLCDGHTAYDTPVRGACALPMLLADAIDRGDCNIALLNKAQVINRPNSITLARLNCA